MNGPSGLASGSTPPCTIRLHGLRIFNTGADPEVVTRSRDRDRNRVEHRSDVDRCSWHTRGGVRHFVHALVRGWSGEARPRIFDAACTSLNLAADEVVMVGDYPRADSGAVLAGIRTILLPALPPHTDNGIAGVIDLAWIHE